MTAVSRRALLGAAPAALASAALPLGARAQGGGSSYQFEIVRSEAEWRDMLSEEEYAVLREGGTEAPFTHPHASETVEGTYTCKGCDLPVFTSRWKVVLDKGWLFFRHSEESAVMTSIDTSIYGQLGGAEAGEVTVPDAQVADMDDEEIRALDSLLLIEVHCRRCASHLGHLLLVDRKVLHCINGTALNFTPAMV
jgi:peptide-methionine (R)-S-oxide reductase